MRRIGEMKEAVEVRPQEGYRIWLRYRDGMEGEVDLSDLAGRGVFKVWADPRVFKTVYIDRGWLNCMGGRNRPLSGCSISPSD